MEIESLHIADYLVIGAYIVTLLVLGFWVSFKKGHTEDLFLAGRNLSWPNIGLSIFGTNVQPSFMIASCGIAYSTGMVAGNFEWLAWIFLMLLAMIFIPHYLNTKVSTMPEFMSKRYDERSRVFLSYYTVFSTLILWLAATLYAGGLLITQILGWPLWLAIIFLIVIATSFTVAGGLTAVVITDSFQSVLMIIASAALTIIGFVKVGGFENLVESVPKDYWTLFRPAGDETYPWPAIILGYPVLGIWFWCTDQTIVQRALGGKNVTQGQLGAVFAGFLKIFTPMIFFLPGILCKILHPDLPDQDQAYMTMVTNYLPAGMVGLIIAVLIAALISTVDSGLNSLSTVFTLDIYKRNFRPDATPKETKYIGRVVTVIGAAVSVGLALALDQVEGMDLFSLLQSLISFLAPSMAAVFLIGVLWKKATSTGAFYTLLFGTITSLGIGGCYLANYPSEGFWPHFMLLAFYLFVALSLFFVVLSLLTQKVCKNKPLPTLKDTYKNMDMTSNKKVWSLWIILAVIMVAVYIIFQYAGTH